MTLDCTTFNEKLVKLWKKYQDDEKWKDHVKLNPGMIGDITKESLLFLGFNPSAAGITEAFSGTTVNQQQIDKNHQGYKDESNDQKSGYLIQIDKFFKKLNIDQGQKETNGVIWIYFMKSTLIRKK